jgi:hypothetical protein
MALDLSNINLFTVFLAIFLGIIIVGAIAWILEQFLYPFYTWSPEWFGPFYNTLIGLYTFIDNSIWILVLFGLLAYLAYTWNNPTPGVAVLDIIAIFLVAYISYTFTPVAVATNNAIPYNSVFPISYSLLINGYLTFEIILGLVVATIFNMRPKT